MSITVYTKPNCDQCDATKRRLDKHGLQYRIVDITEDDTARRFVTSELGYLRARLPPSARRGRRSKRR